MAEPHFGHLVELQGDPVLCLTLAPHFGHTHISSGPAPVGCPVPSLLPLPAGPFPFFPGMYSTSFSY